MTYWICSKCGISFVMFEFRPSTGLCSKCQGSQSKDFASLSEPRRDKARQTDRDLVIPRGMVEALKYG